MGVEPTKNRLAALPGFEVRTPHRGRFSSRIRCCGSRCGHGAKQIQPMLVQAPKVAAAKRDAVAIEEFENLDRDFAAIVEPIAELRCRELVAVGMGGDVNHHIDHLADGRAQKEVIVGDLIDAAEAAGKLQEPAYVRLSNVEKAGDVADAWGTKAVHAG